MAEATDSAQDPPRLGGVPTVTSDEARAVQAALGDHDVTVEGVIEQAGTRVAHLLTETLIGELTDKAASDAAVTVMAGTGHKGAIALAVADRLTQAGVVVNVVLSRQPKEYEGPAATALARLDKSAKKVYSGYNERAFDQADLVVDGLIGAGLDGKPKASISLLIKGANFSMKPIVALDVPTGLDATTGAPSAMTIKAQVTLALALPKRGLTAAGAAGFVGRVFLVDVGVPREAWRDVVGVDAFPVVYGKAGWHEIPG